MGKKKDVKYLIVDGENYFECSTNKDAEEEVKIMIREDVPEKDIGVYEVKKVSKVKLELKLT